jgi:DNA-directed RNA polymerase subunit RPC12/RpoP
MYFARTNFRNQLRKFGIKTDDRRRHMYVIGKTGMGKTVLLENMTLSDIYSGHGCCYVDPHGDTAERLLDFIPSWRINDVVYFNPADLDYPMGFNILEAVDERHKHLVASGMMGVFKKIWENLWSARMEYILNNTILALLDNPGSTLLGINRMLSDAEYRKKIVSNVKDPIVKQFWLTEFASYNEKYAQEAVAPIQNKIGQFLSASVIRNIVAQVKSTLHIREMMDNEKIFIVNLSKGRIGEDNSRLLGGMLITKIQLAAMERVDMDEKDRKDFYLYVDEFQNFAVDSFASILSEARKYRLCLTVAHQYIAQLSDEVREAVFGNVGTLISFRVGSPDAAFMETEFMPRFTPEDVINLPKYNIYLKLLIDGITSQPFSAMTLPPIAQRTGSTEKVIRVSRERYATSREEISDKILKWSGMGDVSDEELLAAAEAKKQASKGSKKPRFEYKCSRCGKEIILPVELDASRPIYCEECREIVRNERGPKKDDRRSPAATRPPAPTSSVRQAAPPKPTSGELVAAPTPSVSVSLSALEEVKSASSVAPKSAPPTQTVSTPAAPHAPAPAESAKSTNDDFLSQVLRSPLTLSNKPVEPFKPQVVSGVGMGSVQVEGARKKKRRRKKKSADRAVPSPAATMTPPPAPPPAPVPKAPTTHAGTIQSGQTIHFD